MNKSDLFFSILQKRHYQRSQRLLSRVSKSIYQQRFSLDKPLIAPVISKAASHCHDSYCLCSVLKLQRY